LAAAALFFVYVRMHRELEFGAHFGGQGKGDPADFVYIAPFEHMFWLCHLALVLPATWFLARGLGVQIGAALSSIARRFDSATRADWIVAGVTFGGLLALMAFVGRDVFLSNLAITDDENAVQFGARVLAHGELCTKGFGPPESFTEIFLYKRDGCVTSMEYPGAVAFGALAILTHLDSAFYAIFAGLTGVAVAHAASRLSGARSALVAALIWGFSPLVATLSMTTHGHLVSRGFLAMAFACFARVATIRDDESAPRNAFFAGLFAAVAFTTRPFETVALFAPVGVWFIVRALRNSGGRSLLALLLGIAGPIALFILYNDLVTGHPFIPPRALMKAFSHDLALGPWQRVPLNLGFNLVLLGVWFLGPAGIALATRSILKPDTPTVLLASGVGLHLLVALGHDNTGIHSVGPIHYTDAAVPLTLLATRGYSLVVEDLRKLAATTFRPAPYLITYAVAGYGTFIFSQGLWLHEQADCQSIEANAVAEAHLHDAIVLAPPPQFLTFLRKNRAGSWVVWVPHPDPYFRDDVIYARHNADVFKLREAFPTRAIYEMFPDKDGRLTIVSRGPGHERVPLGDTLPSGAFEGRRSPDPDPGRSPP
jgi:hypothetical protein